MKAKETQCNIEGQDRDLIRETLNSAVSTEGIPIPTKMLAYDALALIQALERELEKQKEIINTLGEDSDFLNVLEGVGVDNWEGYEIAREIFQETQE
jgi:hypothetical protein